MLEQRDILTFLFTLSKGIPKFAPDIKDPQLVDIWHRMLQNCTSEQLQSMLITLMTTEDQFPSLSRVLQLMAVTKAESFENLVDLIAKHGGYKPPENISHVMAMTINRMGGWQRICEWKNDDLPYRRKEFNETYSACADVVRMAKPENLTPELLIGLHSTIESHPIKKTQPLLSEEMKKVESYGLDKEIDWEAHSAVHPNLDLDLHVSLKSRGFFKLHGHPGFYYRYCFGQKPGEYETYDGDGKKVTRKAVPYSFVEAEAHLQASKEKQQHKSTYDPNKFDSSKYSYDKFVD